MVKQIVGLSCSHVGIGVGGTIAMLGELLIGLPNPATEVNPLRKLVLP